MNLSQVVKISPKAKRITLQRFLLSKVIYKKEEFSIRDLCCLFENQLWLEQKSLTDPDFQRNFGKDLESLSKILKEINFRIEFSEKALSRLSIRLKENLPEFYLPLRNLNTLEKVYNGLFQLKDSQSPGKLKKTIPPPVRIGKGYRDKGSAKDLAYDGSPGWQEVAASLGPIYHKGVPDEGIKTSEAIEPLASQFIRIHREYEGR